MSTSVDLTKVVTPQGTLHYVYDAATGRLVETWTGTSSVMTDTVYGYDAQGRLASVTVGDPVVGGKIKMTISMEFQSKPLSIAVRESALMLENMPFSLPVSEASLSSILGAPDRVVEPKIKAPAGHKSNLFYVYDGYGMYLVRDHESGLLESVTAVFRDGPPVPVLPSCMFTGEIRFPQYTVTAASTMSAIERELKGKISRLIGGMWHFYIGEMHIFFNTEKNELVSVDICRRVS